MAKKSKKIAEVVETVEESKPKMCKCGLNERAISKSGRLSGLCKSCNVEASQKSRMKHSPSRTFQRNTAINLLAELVAEDEIDYKTVRELVAELKMLQ